MYNISIEIIITRFSFKKSHENIVTEAVCIKLVILGRYMSITIG